LINFVDRSQRANHYARPPAEVHLAYNIYSYSCLPMNPVVDQKSILFCRRILTSCSTILCESWLTTNKVSYCLLWQNTMYRLSSYHHVKC